MWSTSTPPYTGEQWGFPSRTPLLWQMWTLQLCVYLCCFLPPGDAEAGEVGPHKCPPPPPEVRVLACRTPCSLPQLGAGCSRCPTGRLRRQPHAEGAMPVGRLPAVSNRALAAAVPSPKSLPRVVISMLLRDLFELTLSLFQKSLCNSQVTV